MSAVQWTSRKVPRRRGAFEHEAEAHGLLVRVEEDRLGRRWSVRGYLGRLRVYSFDDEYGPRRDLEEAKALGVEAARVLAAAGVRSERAAPMAVAGSAS